MLSFKIKRPDVKGMRLATRKAKDFSNPYERVRGFIQSEIQRGLATGGGAVGEHWAPNNPKYRARKAKKGHSTRPMQRTGHINAALGQITLTVTNNGADANYQFTGVQAFAHKGTKNAPARPWFKMSEAAERRLTRLMQHHVDAMFKRF